MSDLKDKSDEELREYIIVARFKGGTVDKLLAFALEEILRLREELKKVGFQ
jgi:6,7-dimethyl-8-ribityllumazine synthase